MQASHGPCLHCKLLTSGSFSVPSGTVLSCGDLSSSQPSLTSALTEGTWEGSSVLCVNASLQAGVRAGGPVAFSGHWVVLGWTWGQGALSPPASFLPSHNQQCLAFVLLGVAMGRMKALYLSSGKSRRSWVFAVPWWCRSPAPIYWRWWK